ncbi:ADP-ribose pyrophosphatase [Actinomadura rubrobrunea]|uniref:ADP-ribose pyrophosphatase n=1 Tax=Actinomadura rubrobrunea TaxID=115335 RepID=A0A9W6PVI3_9ACTN|nr:NUDIX hydrolase [Actinomadura rubrobrunea]GLW63971.1 ADP-ribose pyrophosphatase [Actinomadura rubrobrunea]
MTPEPAVRRVSSRVVYENRWMTVREDLVQRLDGSRGIYGVVEKDDYALVVPAERDGFHLVEEYRYPIGRRTWNFPQGSHPDGGDPEALARRELAEETGLRAGTMTLLGRLHSSHGTSNQGFHVFLATDLTPGEHAREPEEQDMRQRFVTRDEFKQLILSGEITDDATVAAYTLLLLHEEKTAGHA